VLFLHSLFFLVSFKAVVDHYVPYIWDVRENLSLRTKNMSILPEFVKNAIVEVIYLPSDRSSPPAKEGRILKPADKRVGRWAKFSRCCSGNFPVRKLFTLLFHALLFLSLQVYMVQFVQICAAFFAHVSVRSSLPQPFKDIMHTNAYDGVVYATMACVTITVSISIFAYIVAFVVALTGRFFGSKMLTFMFGGYTKFGIVFDGFLFLTRVIVATTRCERR
jgi:hypothetical protein